MEGRVYNPETSSFTWSNDILVGLRLLDLGLITWLDPLLEDVNIGAFSRVRELGPVIVTALILRTIVTFKVTFERRIRSYYKLLV